MIDQARSLPGAKGLPKHMHLVTLISNDSLERRKKKRNLKLHSQLLHQSYKHSKLSFYWVLNSRDARFVPFRVDFIYSLLSQDSDYIAI